jgi:membrane protease YdiL (CAAX protease family)
LPPVVARHPITAFLVLVFVFSVGLTLVPVITEPGLLPGRRSLMGPLMNILGSMVPAFVVTAIISGWDGVRELTRRCLRWRVPLRWYAIALLGMPTATLLVATALYGFAPLRALAEGWPLLFTSFLPTLVVMIVFYNVAEEAGWTGFVFARLQDRHGPLRAALITTVFFWLFHLPTFVVDTDSWALAGVLMGFLLLPHLASRFIVGWLYNAPGATVLIAGLFHATFNSTINSTGFALAVLKLPSEEAFTVLNAMVVLAGVVVVAATKGRLGRRSDERGPTPSPAP